MHPRLSWSYVVFFAALTLLLVELHEQCHAIVTRLACGGWSSRVFDNVLPHAGCSPGRQALVDIAGPLFSYTLLWIGALMFRQASSPHRALGFTLAFASLPLARILPQVLTAFVAGSTSDEYGFLQRISGGAIERASAGTLATVLALALALPPLAILWRGLPAGRRGRWMSGFLLLPLVFVVLWSGVLNGALAQGVLAQPLAAGLPVLLAIHAVAVAGLVFLLRGAPYRTAVRSATPSHS